jgi:Na+/H+-dicarboxylate symporter
MAVVPIAALFGMWAGKEAGLFGLTFYQVFDFVGALFLNALKMLVVPLVVASMIIGIGSVGSGSNLGRIGLRTLAYYLTTSLLAILTGLALVNMIAPGLVNGEPVQALRDANVDHAAVAAKVEGRDTGDLVEIFLRMVPTNVVEAAAQGEMLGLIFFSLLFGYFMTKVQGAPAAALRNFWQGVFDVMMRMAEWVMTFTPIGVFALVGKVFATTGIAAFKPLASFFFTVVIALLVHFLVTLPLLLRWVAGVRAPWRIYRALAPALLTAFSTSSSSATLPVSIECVERNAGVSNRVSSLVLPLGATVNMDGTALYECVAALFIAQVYGIELSLTQQFLVVLLALVTSIGVAGVPAASLVAIAIILAAIGLPAEALAIILAVDRLLDMARTTVNVFSDMVGTVVIARLEGETNVLAQNANQRTT